MGRVRRGRGRYSAHCPGRCPQHAWMHAVCTLHALRYLLARGTTRTLAHVVRWCTGTSRACRRPTHGPWHTRRRDTVRIACPIIGTAPPHTRERVPPPQCCPAVTVCVQSCGGSASAPSVRTGRPSSICTVRVSKGWLGQLLCRARARGRPAGP